MINTKIERFSFLRVLSVCKDMFCVRKLFDDEKCEPDGLIAEPSNSDDWDDKIGDFEYIQLIKYLKNDFKASYDKRNKGFYSYAKWLLKFLDISILEYAIDSSCFRKNIKTLSLYDLEKKIDSLKITKDFLVEYNKQEGLNVDDTIRFFKTKSIRTLIENYFVNFLDAMEKTINSLNQDKKEYYTQNLDVYFDLLGLKDSKEKDVIRFLFYQHVKSFSLLIKNGNTKSSIISYVGLTNDEFKKLLISDVFGLMFYKGKGNKILTNTDFLESVFGIEGGKEYFTKKIIKKTEKSKLSLENFDHIKQKDYIVNYLQNAIKTKEKGVNILLYGKPGTGKTELAKVLIDTIGAEGYDVHFVEDKTAAWRYQDGKEDVKRRKITFYMLQTYLKNNNNAVILYDEAEDFFRKEEKDGQSKQKINNYLENNETPVIWTCNSLWDIEQSFLRRFSYVLELDKISTSVLLSCVQKICKEKNIELDERTQKLIEQEQPSIGIVKQCVNTYKISNIKNQELLYEALKNSIYAESYNTKKPKDVSKNKIAEYDQSLANTNIPLESITNGIMKSGKNDWSMILYGVSGTGKTAYVEYLGKKLGMKVIKKKVSDLQSMWVGECEKNINETFEQARQENAILLFDEGDCWLKDRRFNRASWETSQSNQFLQNLEEATTPVVITTNLMDSLDQAALRRFVFKVGFNYMSKPQVKNAFKTFYNMNVSNEISNISYATPGDFVVVQKQLDYLGEKVTPQKIKELLLDEIKNKKDDFKENSMKI